MIIGGIIHGCHSMFGGSSSKESKQNVTQQQEREYDKNENKPVAKKVDTDLALGKIYIDQHVTEVLSIMGNSSEKQQKDDTGMVKYEFKDMSVVITNETVTAFVSKTSNYTTKRGVKQGDSVDKVTKEYGEPYGNSKYDDVTLYEYEFTSEKGEYCLLRFAVKNGVVDYISGRVVAGGNQNINRHVK